MSQDQHESHSAKPASANIAAVVLIINLIVILVIVGASNVPTAPALVEYGGTAIGYAATQTATYLPSPTFTPSLTPTITPTIAPTVQPTAEPLSPQRISRGETTFNTVCSACHGFGANGVPGLGPSMRDNVFINGQSNEDLLAFIIVGRASDHPDNVSGIAMPARGGNPSITDESLGDVIQYIRSLNPGVVVPVGASTSGSQDMSAVATVQPEVAATAVVEAAVTTEPQEPVTFNPIDLTGITSPDDATAAEEEDPFFTATAREYAFSCSGCHGPQGEGVQMLAVPLSESAVLMARDGFGLLNSLKRTNPAEGYVHPMLGGFTGYTDEQLLHIIGYLYTLPAIQD